MNLVEFNALKAGDRIENAMSNSRGEVVAADARGVLVRWDGLAPGLLELRDGVGTVRTYSRYSTIWFHWTVT